jgi:hypothetical protein
MLITEQKLRSIIRSEIKRRDVAKSNASDIIREGILSAIADKMKKKIQNSKIPSSVEQAIASSSEDCWTLFSAMKGFGTNEEKVNKVLNARKNDLPKLYNEFNTFIKTITTDVSGVREFFKGLTSAGLYTINKKINTSSWDTDLIGWLDGEGMEKQARTLHKQLLKDNSKFKRSKPSGGEIGASGKEKEFGDDEESEAK